ncbi:MAG: Y4bD/Y4pK family protein [Actinobacteria bacterium]|nr:Y4bD/Y4pK family protein [Actinomycetota bacterium]
MTSVVITRSRHPLEGQSLRLLGRMRRHGRLELLLVLSDGSKRLIPQAWTDAEQDAVGEGTTLGSLADLLAACALVAGLAERGHGMRGQAARKSPSKEDFHAACPAQFDTRSAPGASSNAGRAVAGEGHRRRDHATGRRDRQDRHPGGAGGGRQ